MGKWPMVKLGEVLRKSETWIALRPEETYKQITVKLWGKGVVLRGIVAGTEIAASQQLQVKADQFILSRIDARNGAFGLVPSDLDGGVVSNDFPVFDVVPVKMLPGYMGWLCKTRDFVDQCRHASEGTTNRVRLKEDRFLAISIPLPPLAEQRRIVAKIDALAAKIDEARGLRKQAGEEAEALCRSILFSEEAVPTRLEELVEWKKPNIQVDPLEEYQFAGVYSFGRGVFKGEIKKGMEFAYKTLSQVKAGQFTYPKLMAWEGAFGVVPYECDGCYVSPEFPVFDCNIDSLLPETLDVYFKTPRVWAEVSGTSTGTNVRRRRLNPKVFLGYPFPLPPMDVQLKLREVKGKLDSMNAFCDSTQTELDALLPSVLDRAFKGEE